MARLPDTINSYVKKPNKSKRKSPINKQYPQLIDQQWATAFVKRVIINKAHPAAIGENQVVNGIEAIVHGDNLEANYGGTVTAQIFKPLLRGIADVPSRGDQVLVCQFAGESYYLGPLNINNKPCRNEDNRIEQIVNSGYNPYEYNDSFDENIEYDFQNDYLASGTNPYFPSYCPKRIEKPYIHPGLDDSGAVMDLDGVGHKLTLPQMEESEDYVEALHREIPGDLVLEGRMGNYIRLGNRYTYPLTVIANRVLQQTDDNYDKTVGGSILAMVERGSIHTNFEIGPGATNGRGSITVFETSNDVRTVGLIQDGEEAKYGFGSGIYNYIYGDSEEPGGQVLLRSGRVTIDSSTDSIFLSSLKSIILGGGEKVIVRANRSIHIESEKFVLGGNHTSYDDEPDTSSEDYEGMIFGTTFINALKSFLGGLKTIQVATSLGPQTASAIITTDIDTGKPMNLTTTITNLEQELDKVISKKHFIENKKQ